MGLLVPLFVSALVVGPSTPVTKQQTHFQDHVLQRLMQIGPRYPAAFRTIMQGSPVLKQQLEGAIRASQSSTRPPLKVGGTRQQLQQAPAIKLKMDFSNFK